MWEIVPDGAVIIYLTMTPGIEDMLLAVSEDEGFRAINWFDTGDTPKLRVHGVPRRDIKINSTIILRRYIASMGLVYKPEIEIPQGKTMQ